MTLYLLMAALLSVAALWLTRPLWRSGKSIGVLRQHANVAAYRTRIIELDSDVAVGVVPADEAIALKQEMDARLLRDAGSADAPAPVLTPRRGFAALALTLLLLVFAGTWYWQAGSWRVADDIATAPAAGSTPSTAEIEAMVAKLAAKLAADPNNAAGWAMLGRSYFVIARYPDAAAAYAKANQLSQSANAEWLVNEGEALALASDRNLLGRPSQLFDSALALTPDYGKGLWYGALADAQAGQLPRAKQRLQSLLAQDLPDELKATVQARMDELSALSGEVVTPAVAASKPVPVPVGAVSVVVQVTLAPALAKQLSAHATLFVFAKAAKGPPMPLAVQRLPAATLPLTVTLDDSMAMTPAMKLSQFDHYVFTARLSQSGSAAPAAGDLQGSVELSRDEINGPVALQIDQVVP